jgi:hypothetical protein
MATVACLTVPGNYNYRKIAEAMFAGSKACGDSPVIRSTTSILPRSDVGVMYGWKRNAILRMYPKYIHADLGYWSRETHWKIVANGFSPAPYVKAGMSSERFEKLGIDIKPERRGKKVVIAGSSMKSAQLHGLQHMAWETQKAQEFLSKGLQVVYRPKPKDVYKRAIPQCGYDIGPLDFSDALAVVTHHSNVALDALVNGVPVYCETGAASVMNFDLSQIQSPYIPEGREQFLWDCAYLQWTLEEMRSGECWAHLKSRGLV